MLRLTRMFVGLLLAAAPLACASRSAPSTTTPQTGVWTVRGYDGIHWDARLVLARKGEELSGYFEWESEEGDRGLERLEAVFDPKTRKLHLDGIELHDPVGSIMTSTYTAELADDGKRLIEGRWGGFPGAREGTWTAAWLGETERWIDASSPRTDSDPDASQRADAIRERIRLLEGRMDRVEAGFARLRTRN